MSSQPLDPNRFASGFEAQSVRARSGIEQADVELAQKRQRLALETYSAAEQRFIEAEAVYKQCKAEKEDALLYLERAGSHLDASIERLAETNALLHPVRKTPPEVLGIIFESCLEYLPETAPISERQSDIRKRQLQPFYLAAVCRRWRTASLTCPRAWAVFDLLLDDISRSSVNRWKDFVSSHLDRSATRPLDIRIIRKSVHTLYANRVIKRLAGEMGRCQSLLVSAPEVEDSEDVLEPLLTAVTPSLRYLHFLIPRESMLADTSQLFPQAPNVLNVRTSVPNLLDNSDFPNLAGVVLCSPRIGDVEDDVAILVDGYPKLSLLSLVNAHFDDIEAEEKLELAVRVLRVGQNTNSGHLNALPRMYSFPNLSTTTLSGSIRSSESRVALLTELARVAPLLRNLNIENVASADFSRLATALPHLPSLKLLNIKSSAMDSSALTQLCNTLAQPTVHADGRAAWSCPLLKYLKLRTCTLAPGCPQEQFVQLAEGRLRARADAEGGRRPLPLRIMELPLGVDAEIKARVSGLLASK